MSIIARKTLMAAAGSGGGLSASFIQVVWGSIYYYDVAAVASLSNGDIVLSLFDSKHLLKLDGTDFSVEWQLYETSFSKNLGLAVDSDDVIYVASLSTSSSPDEAVITKINADGTHTGYRKYWRHSDNIIGAYGYNAFRLLNGSGDDALLLNTSQSGYDYVGVRGDFYGSSNPSTLVQIGKFNTGGTVYSVDSSDLAYLLSITGKDNASTNVFIGSCQDQGGSLAYRTFQYQINGVNKRSDYPSHFTDPSGNKLYMCCFVDLDYAVVTKFDSIRSATASSSTTFAYNSVGRGFKPMSFLDIDDGMMYVVQNISNSLSYIFKVDTSDMSLVWEYSVTAINSDFYPWGSSKGFKKADTGEIGFGFTNGSVLLFSPEGLPEGTFADMIIAESNNGEKTDLTLASYALGSASNTSATGETQGNSTKDYSSTTSYNSSTSIME
jgi:hypothetical protein